MKFGKIVNNDFSNITNIIPRELWSMVIRGIQLSDIVGNARSYASKKRVCTYTIHIRTEASWGIAASPVFTLKQEKKSHCSSDPFSSGFWCGLRSLFLPLASGLLIIPEGAEVGRGTGAVASHGEGEARWGTHDPIPSTRVMIINPAGTAPFRTSVVKVGGAWGQPQDPRSFFFFFFFFFSSFFFSFSSFLFSFSSLFFFFFFFFFLFLVHRALLLRFLLFLPINQLITSPTMALPFRFSSLCWPWRTVPVLGEPLGSKNPEQRPCNESRRTIKFSGGGTELPGNFWDCVIWLIVFFDVESCRFFL